MDQIPEASENNLPSLSAEKSDIPLGLIPKKLSSWVHVE